MLIHFGIAELIVIALTIWLMLHGAKIVSKPAASDLSALTVTIMPPPPDVETPPKLAEAPEPTPAPTPLPDIDSDGLTQSKTAPEHAMFQSDANMVAASQLPARGDMPLPTMDGPQRKFMDFSNRAAAMGKGSAPAAARPSRPAASSQPAPAMPLQTPNGVTKVEPAATPPPQALPTPQPALAAQATPVPTPTPAPTAPPGSLALGTPTPKPVPPAPTPMDLARLTLPPSLRAEPDLPRRVEPPAPPQQPATLPTQPGTQREQEKTRIDGGIARLGGPAVDAAQTPFGRYHQQLSNLIGSRWKLYLQDHPKDVGEVTILVKLDPSGHVTATRVVENHSLDDLAELSTRAIMESDLPPIPDDLAPMLRDGKLEISFNFNVYDASNDSPGR